MHRFAWTWQKAGMLVGVLSAALACSGGDAVALTINGGAPLSNSPAVSLELNVPAYCTQVTLQNEGGAGATFSPAATLGWNLSAGDGDKTVSATYRTQTPYTYQCGTYPCGSYCCSWSWTGSCNGTCYNYCPQYCQGYTVGTSTESAQITLDTAPPTFTVDVPANSGYTNRANLVVSGTCSDLHGVAGVYITWPGGTRPASCTPQGSYSAELQLTQPGSCPLQVVAVDGAGNSAMQLRNVMFDPVPPALAVSAPANDVTTVGGATFELQGTVSDLFFQAITVNGVSVTVHPDGSFGRMLDLVPGDNQVTVDAVDLAGNHSIVVRNLVRNLPPTIGGTPPLSTHPGGNYSFTPEASDPEDFGFLVFSIENRPAWAAFDPATGRLSGTPSTAGIGTGAPIVISVNDGINPPVALAPFELAVRAFAAPAESSRSAQFAGHLVVDASGTRGSARPGDAGDELAILDRAGNLCGRGEVGADGGFTLTVYGDDPATAPDEGAADGEELAVWLWDGASRRYLPVRTLDVAGGRASLVWVENGFAQGRLHGLAQAQVGTFQIFGNGLAAWFRDADANGMWTPAAGGGLDPAPGYYGTYAMLPVAADWNGDGFSEIGAFENGFWYLDANGNGAWDGAESDRMVQFGTWAMLPVAGDWTGDGVAKVGAFENGAWYLDANGNGQWDGVAGGDVVHAFGTGAMLPVAGDWNGDGVTEIGAYENGSWYLDANGSGQWEGVEGGDRLLTFGSAAMLPVAGDWTGAGRTGVGVFEAGTWYLDIDGNGQWGAADVMCPAFGIAGDKPVVGVWR